MSVLTLPTSQLDGERGREFREFQHMGKTELVGNIDATTNVELDVIKLMNELAHSLSE